MNRTWEYSSPGPNGEHIIERITDRQIIRRHFIQWCFLMGRSGKTGIWKKISLENCIQDFVTVFWAHEVTDEHHR